MMHSFFLEPACVLSSCCLREKRACLLNSQKPWLFSPGLHKLEVQGPGDAQQSEGFGISPSSESPAGAAGRCHPPLTVVAHKLRATSTVGRGLQTNCGTGHKLAWPLKPCVFPQEAFQTNHSFFQHVSAAGARPEHQASSPLLAT